MLCIRRCLLLKREHSLHAAHHHEKLCVGTVYATSLCMPGLWSARETIEVTTLFRWTGLEGYVSPAIQFDNIGAAAMLEWKRSGAIPPWRDARVTAAVVAQ